VADTTVAVGRCVQASPSGKAADSEAVSAANREAQSAADAETQPRVKKRG